MEGASLNGPLSVYGHIRHNGDYYACASNAHLCNDAFHAHGQNFRL